MTTSVLILYISKKDFWKLLTATTKISAEIHFEQNGISKTEHPKGKRSFNV